MDFRLGVVCVAAVACGGPALAPVAPAVDVTVALAPVPGPTADAMRETHTGILDATDTVGDTGSLEDEYEFYAHEGQSLRITMDSDEFDTLLRLRGPSGEVIAQNDDRPGGGVNSQIDSRAPATGRYVALANSYQNGQGGTYTIVLEARTPEVPLVSPVMAAGAAVTIYPGFTPDPQLFTGAAGGPIEASTLNQQCRGWLPASPSHTITVGAPIPYLAIMANSPQDTTLVVQRPNGTFTCDDDGGGGYNPFVSGNFEVGTYQVFVGTYAQGPQANYRLAVTSTTALRPAAI